MKASLFDFTVPSAAGTAQSLQPWAGQVVLVVNTASACGFTPQLEGLQALQARYADQGFTVLAFPCNQFGGQEPGSAEEIATFCSTRYQVTFPVLGKIEVNGPRADPLYAWLTAQAPGWLGSRRIKWNFTKFLVGRDGLVLARYAPMHKPHALAQAIEHALEAPQPPSQIQRSPQAF